MKMTNNRLDYLDKLKAVGIFMVIGTHALSYSMKLSQVSYEAMSFLVHTISVPIFFLVDGYLFSYKKQLKSTIKYTKYIEKSFYRLLVPWFLFTTFYTIVRYLLELSNLLNKKVIIHHSFREVIISSYGSVYAPQLYFLASLFLIRLLAPVLGKIVMLNRYYLLLVFILYLFLYRSSIHLVVPHLEIANGQEPILHALWGLQFYFSGMVLNAFDEKIVPNSLTILIISFVVVILVKYIGVISYGEYIVQYAYLLGMYTFLLRYQGTSFVLSSIGQNTMGIYLIHAPILLKGISILVNSFTASPALSYTLIVILVFIGSYCISMLIKIIPFGNVIFGTPSRKIASQQA